MGRIEVFVRFEVAPETFPPKDVEEFRSFSTEAKKRAMEDEAKVSLMVGLSRDVNSSSTCTRAMKEKNLGVAYLKYLDGELAADQLREELEKLDSSRGHLRAEIQRPRLL